MPPPSSSSSTSVQVALRIRPPTSQDAVSIPARFQRSVIHATSSSTVSVDPSPLSSSSGVTASPTSTPTAAAAKKQLFSFDQVHPPPTTQHALFTSTAQPLISRFLEGFNCTILAYGQTSSGKTYTMTGVDLDADPSDPNNGMGIIPRAVSTIFANARQIKEQKGAAWTYSVKGSFIEIYNEDLIDLLEDAGGTRREVQIREDKDGHIIWGGLREITVKNPAEVMTLLRKGTSIRRTNETDMNAQSSRSHAIFSLTLTQKRYTGSGPPPRASSPLPPAGRSPSRIVRPGSMALSGSPIAARVASPSFGRPSTPSFVSAIGRGGGLRPSSALGLRPGDPHSPNADDEPGEWVTIVSKFHFVDLAGSERLKRTAAVGERIKEGISINSGLLALGNVISALGDPSRAKSNTASHVPYRDSKLTRLLQDSLGGNAHTLMIACVSPAEWNTAETVNTLKYANRARNIKNRAVVNEKEDGWDDVEWLQGTVSRLRKELKAIKETGGVMVNGNAEVPETGNKKVLAQMTDLQNNYEDLREKFVERTEELTRLRRELGLQQRNSLGGSVGGTAKYEEIVGPVIEEYEKTIAAMEAELSLNRAALRMTNEMVEEKEEEVAVMTERHAATELYVEELKSRVVKLTEREASTEAYVRDLEEKIKTYDDSNITSSVSMTDLKREVAKFKDIESQSTGYIADLEARLGQADESVLALRHVVEGLEQDCERRRSEAEVLQSRLERLKQDGESWRADLEEREQKVHLLEARMAEWERKRKAAGEDRERLGNVAGEVAQARRSLESLAQPGSASGSEASSPDKASSSVEAQLVALRETHTATLEDLSSVTAKYRDALREISDLASQIQEAKLNEQNEEASVDGDPGELSPRRRRATGPKSRDSSEQLNGSGSRRLFFRQAASVDSLHARSLSQSQSLSQELSSAQSRKASMSSHGTSGGNSISRTHSPSASGHARPSLSISLPGGPPLSSNGERSVMSLEKEIMRLQEALKEREAEIGELEESLRAKPVNGTVTPPRKTVNGINGHSPSSFLSPKTLTQFNSIRRSMENDDDDLDKSKSVSESDESLDRLNELMLSMAQKESQHREVVDDLTEQLSQVRRLHDDLTALARDQTLNMSKEIESLQAKHSEDLAELESLKAREAELLANLKTAETKHSADIESLKSEHEAALRAKGAEVDDLVARLKGEHETFSNELRGRISQSSEALSRSAVEHEEAFGKLKAEHETALQRQIQAANGALAETHLQHDAFVSKLRRAYDERAKQKEAEASVLLHSTEEDYYNALTKLRGDHADALAKNGEDAAIAMERLKQEHASELRMAEIAQQGSLSESQSERDTALKALRDEHAAAISRKSASLSEELAKVKADHAQALITKDEDHQLVLSKIKAEHEGVLARLREESRVEVERLSSSLAQSKSESAATTTRLRQEMDVSIQSLQEQQAAVLQEIERGHEEDVAQIKRSHEAVLKEAQCKAAELDSSLSHSHSQELAKLAAERSEAEAKSNSALIAAQNHHSQSLDEAKAQVNALLSEERKKHDEAVAAANASNVSALEKHRQELAEVKAQSERSLAEERNRFDSLVADLELRFAKDRELLQKEYDALVKELNIHKSAAEEYVISRDETRRVHENALAEKDDIISDIGEQLVSLRSDRDSISDEVTQLRVELQKTQSEQSRLVQEASKRESLVSELEKHRHVIAEMQESLQRVKDEKDNVQFEKNRLDAIVKELQAQVARSASPPGVRSPADRNIAFTRSGLPATKLPPPTPPPNVPPPPAPRGMHSIVNEASTSSQGTTSSRESTLDSPSTSVGTVSTVASAIGADPKAMAKIEQQAKQIDEQEAMIKTLNKQLTHCETDLQSHMDMVSSLESSVNDSEKNLKKIRTHATDLARERDMLNNQIESLRHELQEAKREVVTVRRSIVEEKQSLEQRLDEERKAKERARAQLDSRMEEISKRKSKFACL